MVFYEITIIKGNPIGTNDIAFRNSGNEYRSRTDNPLPNYVASRFVFKAIDNVEGFLGNSNETRDDFIGSWILNGIEQTFFPPNFVAFQPGDCIHIVNDTVLGFDAVVEIWNSTNFVLQSETLAPGGDLWINWRGADSRLSNQPCCVHPETQVLTPLGFRKISQLKTNQQIMASNNRVTTIKKNIRFVPTKEFIRIKKGALSKDTPKKDLLIRPGHPILLNGTEVDPQSLIKRIAGIKKIKLERPAEVYTLCTNRREFVDMQGVPVATWEYEDWIKFANKHPEIVFWEQ